MCDARRDAQQLPAAAAISHAIAGERQLLGADRETAQDRRAPRLERAGADAENGCDVGRGDAVDEHPEDREIVGIDLGGYRAHSVGLDGRQHEDTARDGADGIRHCGVLARLIVKSVGACAEGGNG